MRYTATATLISTTVACSEAAPAAHPLLVVYSPVERARTDSAAALSWSYSVDADHNGNIFVADRSAIRMFAPDGRLLRSIGREGRGPGEFALVRTVELMPGDSVYAFDVGISRVTVFEPGTWRAAYTVQVGKDQLFAPYEVRRVRGGHAITARFEAAYGEIDGRAQHGHRKAVIRLLNADGSLSRDSVLAVPEREHLILHNPDGVAPNPFGRATNVAFASGDRIVTEWSDSLKFDVYSVDGRHLKTIRPAISPPRRPITREERDSVVSAIANELVPAPSVRRAVEEHGASTWPLVQDMVVDDQDRIWVGITGLRDEPNHWTAFDMDGEPVGQLDLPGNMQLRLVRGSRAYVVATDINDVPQVVVFDLKPTQTLAMNRR